jgi:hypothetical protein
MYDLRVSDWMEIGDQARKAAAVDVSMLPDDELLVGIGALVEARSFLDATLGHLLAEIDVRKATEALVGLTAGAWFAREAGVPVAAGKDRVRVARQLHDRLDEVDQAVVDGRLSWEHARVLAHACNPRVAHRVAAVQAELIGLAEGAVFDAWRRQVAGIVALLDEDGAFDPDEDLARNHLRSCRRSTVSPMCPVHWWASRPRWPATPLRRWPPFDRRTAARRDPGGARRGH